MFAIDNPFSILEKEKYPLVNKFYKKFYKKGIAGKNEQVYVVQKKEIICAGKIKRLDDTYLLTGVVCNPVHQGQGYASYLIRNILLIHNKPIYCFPYSHLEKFYTQQGFVPIDTLNVPETIQHRFINYSQHKALLLMIFNP